MAPIEEIIVSAVAGTLKQAFSWNDFFDEKRGSEGFKSYFRDAFQYIARDKFDKLFEKLYGTDKFDGLSKHLEEDWNDGVCGQLRDWAKNVAPSALNIISNVVKLHQEPELLFELYKTAALVLKEVPGKIHKMQDVEEALKNSIDGVDQTVEELRRSWVDFAKQMSESDGLGAMVWGYPNSIPQLRKCSEFIDRCENSMPLCQRTLERFTALREQTEKLRGLISLLPKMCFDLQGNLLSGFDSEAALNIQSLVDFGTTMSAWMTACPSHSDTGPSTLRQVHEGGNTWVQRRSDGSEDPHGDHCGDRPDQINDNDMQFGVNRFDFGYVRQAATRLTGGDEGRWLKKRASYIDMWDTRLEWIQVPQELRDHAICSWVILDSEKEGGNKGNPKRIVAPNREDRFAPNFINVGPDNIQTDFEVIFPTELKSDNVVVRAWIVDMNVLYEPLPEDQRPPTVIDFGRIGSVNEQFRHHVPVRYHGLWVQADDSNHRGFVARVGSPSRTWPWYLRIGYVAYDASGTSGLFTDQYRITTQRGQEVSGFPAKYFPFPPGTFQRRPCVAPMLSSWILSWPHGQRVDVQWASTRDGVIVQPMTWADTIISDLRFELLAIATSGWQQ